mgnify:FL=1
MKLHDHGVYLVNGQLTDTAPAHVTEAEARKGTIAYGILKAHNTAPDMKDLRIKFDSMTSHDITYVGIIQTARASGMEKFPLPYVLTNCHNSLCAVGGTINEDDHQFALSAAHKYGGIYVPPNMAVIHSYNREMMAGCGRMILGSDSHTRYGALGTMAVGEGGGELAKQLVGRTYDMAMPGVICVYLTGRLNPGVGPHDVALALVGATYANGYVKNKVMEFVVLYYSIVARSIIKRLIRRENITVTYGIQLYSLFLKCSSITMKIAILDSDALYTAYLNMMTIVIVFYLNVLYPKVFHVTKSHIRKWS